MHIISLHNFFFIDFENEKCFVIFSCMYTEKKIKQDRIVSRSYLSLMRQFSEDVKKVNYFISVQIPQD